MPQRVATLASGDLRLLAEFSARGRLNNRASIMPLSTDCAAGATRERRAEIDRQLASSLLGTAALIDLLAMCPEWPVEPLADLHRSPVRSDVPVLFVSGSLDARTPPSNAEEVARGFPNARTLLIEGGSHEDDLFLSSPEIVPAMIAFLKGRDPGNRRIVLPPLRLSPQR